MECGSSIAGSVVLMSAYAAGPSGRRRPRSDIIDSRDSIVIVSGLPRSGTSLMMQMLQRAGVQPMTDGIRAADEDNPRGYYELERVKRLAEDCSWLHQARGRAVKCISPLLMSLPVGPTYRVLFMRRDLDEVLTFYSDLGTLWFEMIE